MDTSTVNADWALTQLLIKASLQCRGALAEWKCKRPFGIGLPSDPSNAQLGLFFIMSSVLILFFYAAWLPQQYALDFEDLGFTQRALRAAHSFLTKIPARGLGFEAQDRYCARQVRLDRHQEAHILERTVKEGF